MAHQCYSVSRVNGSIKFSVTVLILSNWRFNKASHGKELSKPLEKKALFLFIKKAYGTKIVTRIRSACVALRCHHRRADAAGPQPSLLRVWPTTAPREAASVGAVPVVITSV